MRIVFFLLLFAQSAFSVGLGDCRPLILLAPNDREGGAGEVIPTDEALRRSIAEDPQFVGLRLVYADWLDENGWPDRAEFIRGQIQLGTMSVLDPQYRVLQARMEELLKGVKSVFSEREAASFGFSKKRFVALKRLFDVRLPKYFAYFDFENGFPERLILREKVPDDFSWRNFFMELNHFPLINTLDIRRFPLRSISMARFFEAVRETNFVTRIRKIDFSKLVRHEFVNEDAQALFLGSFPNVEEIDLGRLSMDRSSWNSLRELTQLRILRFDWRYFVPVLTAFKSLEKVEVRGGWDVGGRDLRDFLLNCRTPKILELNGIPSTDAQWQALRRWERLPDLDELYIRTSAKMISRIKSSPEFSLVKKLFLFSRGE